MNAASNAADYTRLPAIDDQTTVHLARRCIHLSDVFHRQLNIAHPYYSELINECVGKLHQDHRSIDSLKAWTKS